MKRAGEEGKDVSDTLKRSVVAHYEDKLARHGPTARGMDWKDEESQRLRFSVLCDVCDLTGLSVHEIGAGAGHMCDYLRERGLPVDYSGSDLSPAMVEAARTLHPGVEFDVRDPLAEAEKETWDVVLCSGVFHVKLDNEDDDWRRFVECTLVRMFESCRVAIAFNLMSDHVDFRSSDLYYADVGRTLDFCRRKLSRSVVLRHDYPLYEYTVYVYRNPRS